MKEKPPSGLQPREIHDGTVRAKIIQLIVLIYIKQ